jgi:uncharacterized protein YndB with AHSA1/START domain
MPVSNTTQDPQALTFTLEAEFAAPVERVWQLWADPRQLERWWGPPTWPATFDRHELKPGGESRYYMTGPDGTKAHGWWTVTEVDEPTRIEFDDGFAGPDGEPLDPEDKTTGVVTLTPYAGGTRMLVVSTFRDTAQMERMVKMGMVEGMTQAVNQIDVLLAGPEH